MKWFNLGDYVNLLGFAGMVAIVLLLVFVLSIYIRRIRDTKATGELANHSWDGIGEQMNNVPLGWGATFFALIIWGLWYMFLGYPINAYSQIGEYNKDMSAHKAKYAAKWASLDEKELAQMGGSIFSVQCAGCHGISAEGMNGKAANLTAWGKEAGIIYTIKHGSSGLGFTASPMPALPLSDEDAKAAAAYVMSAISNTHKTEFPTEVQKGKAVFENNCAACHGADGKGMAGMSDFAPNLSEYGTSAFLNLVLKHGKKGNIGIMPSFDYVNFSQVQIKALAAYINSLTPIEE